MQKTALHEAMLAYLTSQGDDFAQTVAAFRKNTGITKQIGAAALKKQTLERKWTGVIRLQKKVRSVYRCLTHTESKKMTFLSPW